MTDNAVEAEDMPNEADDGASTVNVVTSAVSHPTVFADGCLFAYRMSGTVRMAFVESMIEAANGPYPGFKTRHVGTLVLPMEGLKVTLDYLNKLVADWDAEDGH